MTSQKTIFVEIFRSIPDNRQFNIKTINDKNNIKTINTNMFLIQTFNILLNLCTNDHNKNEDSMIKNKNIVNENQNSKLLKNHFTSDI